MSPRVAGLLLAAGEGRRYGQPKALVDTGSGPWVRTALATMRSLEPKAVVIGAAADRVGAIVPRGVAAVFNPDYSSGMGGSLSTGLRHFLADTGIDAVLVMLVDLPDVGDKVVDRVAALAAQGRSVVARAAYGGVSGHPVLLGRDHLLGVISTATGDTGARTYLAAHTVQLVECADIGSGRDVDQAGEEDR